jgi:cyanophycinase
MMNSVESLVIPSPEAANDPFVIQRLSHASAIFIAGGDQYTYYLNWKNTAVSRLLNEHVKKGTPLAGTSAGLAILGEFAFVAALDTVDSVECLKNPFDQRVTIAQNLLELEILKGWITDTHFHIRDRMGRMLTFMARTQRDFDLKTLHGVAVDEDTSVVINSEYKAYVIGLGAAYMMNSTSAQVILDPTRGLDYRVEVFKMIPTRGAYDFRIQQPLDYEDHYFLTSVNGIISSTKKNNEVYKVQK